MTEDQLLRGVLDMAGALGWWTYHARPAMTRAGKWVTPAQGTLATGWPDLVLAHPRGEILYVELKSASRQTESQRMVEGVLRMAGATFHLWQPRDWRDGTIERILRGAK